MANNPYVNKVVYGGTTIIDISDTTATSDKILSGYGAYGADGQWMNGTASSGPGDLQSKTVDPSTSQIVVEPDTGYDGLSSVTVDAIKLQEKSVTPSSAEQIITPDKITYAFNIPAGTQNTDTIGLSLRWSNVTQSLQVSTDYDWDGEITTSDGTVITISGTYVYNYSTTITNFTVTGPSTVNAILAIDGTLYVEFVNGAPASGTVTKAILAHPHGQEEYDGLSKVTVAAVVPTSSSYTLLGSHEFTVNTSSTSAESVGTFTVPTTVWTKDRVIYVCIRDKAGKRAGYFYGTDNWFININVQTGSTSAFTSGVRYIRRYSTSSVFGQTQTSSNTGYGVYAYSISNAGTITIYSRYSSSYSLTINGTYVVEVYALDLPGGTSPFA